MHLLLITMALLFQDSTLSHPLVRTTWNNICSKIHFSIIQIVVVFKVRPEFQAPSGYFTQTNYQIANLFFTGYDQQNPFPFGGDVNMDNYQDNYGGTGQNEGGENSGGARYQW